jgi:hypothetical protein
MAKASFPGARLTGPTWHLTVTECSDHRLALDGLPEDRAERLSLVMRMRDLLAAVMHADDVDREGSGILWRRYARAAWISPTGWQSEVTVEQVPAERET